MSPQRRQKSPVSAHGPWLSRALGYRNNQTLGSLETSFVAASNQAVAQRSTGHDPDLYSADFVFREYMPVSGFLGVTFIPLVTKIGILLLAVPWFRTVDGQGVEKVQLEGGAAEADDELGDNRLSVEEDESYSGYGPEDTQTTGAEAQYVPGSEPYDRHMAVETKFGAELKAAYQPEPTDISGSEYFLESGAQNPF